MSSLKMWAIVPAAGVGKRFNSGRPKQYHLLGNKTVLEHSIAPLVAHPLISKVVVALREADSDWPQLVCSTHPKIITVTGGAERSQTVLNALLVLDKLAEKEDWVLVHDAARPCLYNEDLEKLIKTLNDNPVGGLLASPVRDTMKEYDQNDVAIKTVDRSRLWHALTPQMFRYGLLCNALRVAQASGKIVTDEAQAIELLGYKPVIVEGRSDNIKITRNEDLALAEFFMRQREDANTNRVRSVTYTE